MPKYIFMDTNVFLHFKPIEDFKLPNQYGKGCCLVVPRVILGELNKHKDSHPLPKIQKRAKAICKKIQEWDKSGQITTDLKFQFVIATSDPKQHGLDPDSPDDRFLSDILLFEAPSENKNLLANDANMLLTAKHLGISTEEIDEDLKLPLELDPLKKENQELQRQLSKLENALPKLTVGLASSGKDKNVDQTPIFPLESKEYMSDEEIESKVSSLKLNEYQQKDPVHGFLGIQQTEIDRYNTKIREYPDRYQKYLQALRSFESKYLYRFKIGILNQGTAPANDIDISLHFPNGFEMYLKNELPAPPEEPSLPSNPTSLRDRFASMGNLSGLSHNFHVPNIDLPKSYSLKRTNSYDFKDYFKNIKHNTMVLMPELLLAFKNFNEVKSFQCTYRITLADLPEPVEGKINFRFEKCSSLEDHGDADE